MERWIGKYIKNMQSSFTCFRQVSKNIFFKPFFEQRFTQYVKHTKKKQNSDRLNELSRPTVQNDSDSSSSSWNMQNNETNDKIKNDNINNNTDKVIEDTKNDKIMAGINSKTRSEISFITQDSFCEDRNALMPLLDTKGSNSSDKNNTCHSAKVTKIESSDSSISSHTPSENVSYIFLNEPQSPKTKMSFVNRFKSSLPLRQPSRSQSSAQPPHVKMPQ